MAEDLYHRIIINFSRMPLDELKMRQQYFATNTDGNIIAEINRYMDAPDVYGNYKGTLLMTFINSFTDTKYIASFKKDLDEIVSNLEKAESAPTSAVVPVRKKTRAETYVSPPKPILPTSPTTAEKRDATRIEGIEEREVSPKSKARAKAATTRVEADDPRALSLDEESKATTVLNDFLKYEIKSRQSENISFVEDYLKNTIYTSEKVEKELESYIRRNGSMRNELFNKTKNFMFDKLRKEFEPQLKKEVEDILKSKLSLEIKSIEQEHNTLAEQYRKQKGVIAGINAELKATKDEDELKALELRKSVADKEGAKLLSQLNILEKTTK